MDSEIRLNIIANWAESKSSKLDKMIRIFEKVRDLPYGSIGSRDSFDVYKQQKGTCSGKHQLLKELYLELGIQVQDCIVMHRFNDLLVKFPESIAKILDKTEIIDPHNFLKVKIDNSWITIDATWDKPLKELGFPVNESWNGMTNQSLAVRADGKIFEAENINELKEQLLAKLPEEVQKQRKIFLSELTDWLDTWREENYT